MRHQFSIRFKPASGAHGVQAEAYVQALAAVLEGLASLRAALAPELAARHGWAVPQVRDALTFSIGPTDKGSLVVPIVPGAVEKGPPLAADAIAQAFFREASAELGRVPKGKAGRLSASGADAFARASSAAKESHATLDLATKAGGRTWRALAPITPIEKALRKHAESRRAGYRATTSLSGQIVSLTYDPPGFILVTANARRTVRMPSTLRDRARENWGREVVVLSDALMTSDGAVSDVQAIDIRPAATAEHADEGFDQTFGIMRGAWDGAAVRAQLDRSGN
jgi:hypothetical protein